jgi:type II secretory pathway pseudopilin PulG
MGKSSQPGQTGDRGYSTIEVMIAGALIGFIAIALLPAIFSLVDTSRAQAFRSVCNTMVRAKLQEYLTGVARSGTGGSLDYIPSGFEYTKQRYQQRTADCQPSTDGNSPGFRERVNTNDIVIDTAGQEPGLPASLRGFQMYVLLRHYNPRMLVGGQPKRSCPPDSYQFFRLGDAIEVTVTGMIRTGPTVSQGGRDGERYGKFEDHGDNPHPLLTCSASQIVYPPRLPFRYYLGSDGKIRNYQATLAVTDSAPMQVARPWNLTFGASGLSTAGAPVP